MSAATGAPAHTLQQLGHRRVVLALGLGVVLYVLYRRRGTASGIVGSTDPTAADTAGVTSPDGSLGGLAGGTSGDTATSAALEGLQSGYGDLSSQLANFAAQQQSINDALFQAQQDINDATSLGTAGPTIPAGAPDTPITAVAPPNPPSASGFWWTINGRNTFVTKQNAGAFIRAEQSKGANLQVWASQHPTAARTIGITPPAAPPPVKKQPASPVPTATVVAPPRQAAPSAKAATVVPVYVHSPGANPVAAHAYVAAVKASGGRVKAF